MGVVFLAAAIWIRAGLLVPTYHGHRLAFWIRELKTKRGEHEYLEAKEALIQLRWEAAPPVARLLDYHEPRLLTAIRAKIPDRLRDLLTSAGLPAYIIRNRAFNILREMGPQARAALPQLIRLMESPDSVTRLQATEILGSIGPRADLAVPALVSLLRSGGTQERQVAARSLGAIGSTAARAIPELVSAMEANRIPLAIAVPALIGLGYSPAEAVPLLIEQLRTRTDSPGRLDSIRCLGLIGVPAAPAVPALIEALQDPESRTCARVAFALGQIGLNASNAVPALILALDDEWWYVRENAAIALGKIGSTASSAIPVLTRLAQGDQNEDVRKAAVEAIRLTGPITVESPAR